MEIQPSGLKGVKLVESHHCILCYGLQQPSKDRQINFYWLYKNQWSITYMMSIFWGLLHVASLSSRLFWCHEWQHRRNTESSLPLLVAAIADDGMRVRDGQWLRHFVAGKTKNNKKTWLVVYLPLWKIWKSVGMIIPNIWEKCSKPPTSNIWNQSLKRLLVNRVNGNMDQRHLTTAKCQWRSGANK